MRGIELSQSARRNSELRRFRTLAGISAAEIGDRGLALQHHLKALESAIAQDEGIGVFSAWNNISALFVDSGQYEEAIACSRQSLKVCDEYGIVDQGLVGKAHSNISLALSRLGFHREALRAAYLSIKALKDPVLPEELASRVVREEHLILALISLGQFSKAKKHVDYLKFITSNTESFRLLAIVQISEGLLKVAAGNADEGMALLEVCVRGTVQRKLPVAADALYALLKAYQLAGQSDKALGTIDRIFEWLYGRQIDTSIAQRCNSDSIQYFDVLRRGGNEMELKKVRAEMRARSAELALSTSQTEILERLAIAADIREDISGEHGFRVGRLSALLAREIGWERDACDALDIAARLHDIGKFGIPEKILLDEKTLRDAERQFIEAHTRVGGEILSRSDIPQVRIAEEIARYHHERWDGAGYPKQLKGTDIPKSARIVALADVFDAITHGRPYAPPRPVEEALDLIASLRGRQFDPELTDHFLALVRRLVRENKDLDAYLGKAARHSPFLKARARIKELLAQERDGHGLSASPRPPGVFLN
ncbi:MAG: HD domain-containing protein [Betaproteobacteria bacterium]|nr:HD domain-containing protein [Betaproteobacteria bacterium]